MDSMNRAECGPPWTYALQSNTLGAAGQKEYEQWKKEANRRKWRDAKLRGLRSLRDDNAMPARPPDTLHPIDSAKKGRGR